METPSSPSKIVNFEELVKKHGYVSARQLLKRSIAEKHQAEVETSQKKIHDSFQDLRFRESTKLSRTVGGVGNRSLIDKILQSNRSIQSLEKALESGSLYGISQEIKNHEKTLPKDQFLADHKVQYALNNQPMELLLPNADLTEFPLEFADTIFLQTNRFQHLKCVRNNFRSFCSHNLPQLSIYHFKYAQTLDFSLNKLVRLPDNIGCLQCLHTINLSKNYLAKLPPSFHQLSSLHTLDLSGNSFSQLPEEFGFMDSLINLNLSENLFSLFPYAVVRLRNIKKLTFNRNSVSNLAILPPLLEEKDLWIPTIDRRTGKNLWMNVLTREKVQHIEHYNGEGVKKKRDLHIFQPETDVRRYKQRKMYLSACGIHEWEPGNDSNTGRTFYQNNISGATSWELPAILNTFGNMSSIEELIINNNAIKELPSSFLRLTLLRKLCLNRNRLDSLPEMFGELKQLQILQLSNNELTLLPTSICDCKELTELLLDDNHLLRLPENLGFLPKLAKLDISHNRLKTVPFSLGYCSSLQKLYAHENPLEDPPLIEFEKSTLNVQHILWYLRNRYLMVKNGGKPPLVTFHQISINQEITIIEQDLMETIQTRLDASKREGFLNLQLLGLKEIPPLVIKAAPKSGIRKIKLDFNPDLNLMVKVEHNSDQLGFPKELKKIHSLSIRGCRLKLLPDNIYLFEKMTFLNLEENLLEFLPEGFCELLTVTNINLSRNHLYELPSAIHNLEILQSLNLESNYLEKIPGAIGQLKELRVLNLSKNRLIDIPEEICQLAALRVLNLEKNQLIGLPQALKQLQIIDLRIGHNYIEWIAPNLFQESLGKSIRFFSCVENNLLELPESIIYLDSMVMIEFDYNPYISPPPYLISEGLVTLQNYFKIRQYRQRLLYELMLEEDFELSFEAFTPYAYEILEDGTGFLTPEDLAAFDQAVDEYVNGEFYKCPATGEEIVASITKLREDREVELYLTIIRSFLKVVTQLVSSNDPRYSELSVFSSQRPWGKDGELCNVWVISLQALLRDTPPNVYYPNGRPSIFRLVSEALPKISFPFTIDLLKDSLRLYISPYGNIADTEEVVFTGCDCMDDYRNKPKRHNPCSKPAVVVSKSVYVEEEAHRRVEEEDLILTKFQEIEDEIRVWILTDEGKTLLEKEVKKRKAVLREEIQLREELILSQQLKYKKALDHLKMVETRKAAFEAGGTYDLHGFHSVEEAISTYNKAEEEANRCNARIELLKEKVNEIKAELDKDWKSSCRQAISDLVEKYCAITYEAAVKTFRQKALDKGLNRHWDGDEGQNFELWKRKHLKRQAKEELLDGAEGGEDEDSEEEEGDGEEEKKKSEEDEDDEGNLPPEFDWSQTENMEKYKVYLFKTYRHSRPFDIEFRT